MTKTFWYRVGPVMMFSENLWISWQTNGLQETLINIDTKILTKAQEYIQT